jgi:hypothetical protein
VLGDIITAVNGSKVSGCGGPELHEYAVAVNFCEP